MRKFNTLHINIFLNTIYTVSEKFLTIASLTDMNDKNMHVALILLLQMAGKKTIFWGGVGA